MELLTNLKTPFFFYLRLRKGGPILASFFLPALEAVGNESIKISKTLSALM